MLRNNTESFAPELSSILTDLGVNDEATTKSFQLLKFERIEPDVFIWLLRGISTYLVTLHDGGSNTPNIEWLADWCGGLKRVDLEILVPKDDDPSDQTSLEDGYDYVKAYRLPKSYDHCDHINKLT